jgi:hypothetical protein
MDILPLIDAVIMNMNMSIFISVVTARVNNEKLFDNT